jgi:hypothetical protein
MTLDEVYNIDYGNYEETNEIAFPVGANQGRIEEGETTTSLVNKIHLIKVIGIPYNDERLREKEIYKNLTYSDLCNIESHSSSYDPDDFLYCKHFGLPINHLITLRRFPYPCTDNIGELDNMPFPDLSRMVTYFHQDLNKLDELLSFSYAMKWKELESEMEQATMQGDQSGFSGMLKKVYSVIDPTLWKNKLQGENAQMLDPKYDQNRVYGPVNSIKNTNIRDVGLEFTKDFDITFYY